MKKKLLLCLLTPILLTSCNKDITPWGKLKFDYAYVKSSILGEKCYHIKKWKEYEPEGGSMNESYIGLEIRTISGAVYYFWEINLQYVLSTYYDTTYGELVE